MSESLKQCSRCGQHFPATDEFFYHDSAKSDKLQRYCKPCDKESKAERVDEKKRRRDRLSKLIRVENGEPVVDRTFLIEETITMYEEAKTENVKMRCLEFLYEVSGVKGKPRAEDDKALIQKLMKSARQIKRA